MNYRKGTLLLGTGSALVLAMAAPAIAKTGSAAAQAGEPGDIVVTARRVEERLQDVPVSVAVYNQQQLSDTNISNAAQLASFTPGLQSSTRFGADNATFSIRGFNQEVGTAPSVGIYFADVQAPRSTGLGTPAGDGAGPGTLFDLQNIQILKGPQGTLFGRNTTGGAILIVPQKPTSNTEGYVEGSYGNFNMRRLQGVLNIPIADTLRARFGVDHMKRQGYQHNYGYGPSHYGQVNYLAFRGSLVWDVTDNVENYTILSWSRSAIHPSVSKLVVSNPGLAATLGQSPVLAQNQLQNQINTGTAGFYDTVAWQPDPRAFTKRWQVINTTSWKVSDYLTLKNIFSYAQLKNSNITPLFGSGWIGNGTAGAGGAAALGLPRVRAESRAITGGLTAAHATLIEEVQLQGSTADNNLTYQAGVYYESVKPIQTVGGMSGSGGCINGAYFLCPGGGSINFQKGEISFRNVGVYAQGSYNITDSLTATLGLRYTWDYQKMWTERRTYTVSAAGVATNTCTDAQIANTACRVLKTNKSDAPTWVGGLDWKPSDDILLYAKWSRGYRTGGLIPAAPGAFQTYKPEKLNTYEVGAKTSFRGPIPGTFNVALFHNNFQNAQLQAGLTPLPGLGLTPAAGIINLARTKLQGAEIDLQLRPFQGFTLGVNYAYLNGKIKDVGTQTAADPSFIVNTSTLLKGDRVLFVPKNKYSISANYVLPFSEDIGKLSIGANFTHTDSMMTNYANRTVPGFERFSYINGTNLLNANINWKGIFQSPVDLALFATNLTNKKYLTSYTGGAQSGFEYATIGEPRMYGVRLKYSFGD